MAKNNGALWMRTAKSGLVYMSGILDISEGYSVQISVFKNTDKQGKQPDYNILLGERVERKPRPERGGYTPPPQPFPPQPQQSQYPEDEINPNEIPF